jgi:hypothetical protein
MVVEQPQISTAVRARLRRYRSRGQTCLGNIENAGRRAAVEGPDGTPVTNALVQGRAVRKAFGLALLMPYELVLVEVDTGAFEKALKWISDLDGYATGSLPDRERDAIRSVQSPELSPVRAGRPRPTIDSVVGTFRQALAGRLAVLDELLGLNDPANTVDTHDREAAGGWNHLRGLGIIDDNVLDGHLKTIRTRRTRAEQSAAIGAAKELLEATLKGVLLHYNPEADISGDLPKLWKEVRSKLVTDSDSDPSLGSKDKGIAQLSGSLAGVIDGLAYIRNRVGSGHGRSRPPRGLSESHVLLSVDSVYTLTRFIAQRYKERAMSQK